MTIPLNDLGGGYPTFPQFQQMLREYEARTPAVIHADNNREDIAYTEQAHTTVYIGVSLPSGGGGEAGPLHKADNRRWNKDGARIYPNWNRMPR